MTDDDRLDDDRFDDHMVEACEHLEPSAAAYERMEGVVIVAHAIAHRPLAAEWLELFRDAPIAGPLRVAAAAIVMVIATLGALIMLAQSARVSAPRGLGYDMRQRSDDEHA